MYVQGITGKWINFFHQQTFEKLSMTKYTTCSGCNRLKRKCATFIWQTSFSKAFHDNIKYIAVVTASKQTRGNFEVRCPHPFLGYCCNVDRLRFYMLFHWVRQEYTQHIRSIYVHMRAYTGHIFHIRSIYGAFFAYTCIYGAFFCIYGAYTGHFFAYTEHIRGLFFAYTEHIRGLFLHIRSIYGAYTEHIRAYTGIFFQIRSKYGPYRNKYSTFLKKCYFCD